MTKKKNKNNEENLSLKYLVALIISFITFISGIFLGLALAKKEVYLVGIKENNIKSSILELETTIKFLEENICDDKLLKNFGVDLDTVGEELESLSNKLFVSKEEYESLRNFYYSLEVNHYLLLKKAEKLCNKNYYFIFYFYNNVENCKKCYEQGLYLTVLKKKYEDLVQIYNFNIDDYNNSLLIKKMTLKYNIDPNLDKPVLVINGNKYNFLTLEELENLILNNKNNKTNSEKNFQLNIKRNN